MPGKLFKTLAVRNLIFTILQPGIVAGLIPYFIAKNRFQVTFNKAFSPSQYFGIAIFTLGLLIVLHCISRFVIDGEGTLSPADPTKNLVRSGLYRFSRNPMYVGVLMILCGEAIFSESAYLWIYCLIIFTTFNLFIVLREEPRLKKDFGEHYEKYCRMVRRWI